jgi:hypothetical protein
MSVVKFKAGRKGASGRNASYITRESACESISFHNLDELKAENQYENRVNALSYTHNREEEEIGQSARGRTHYRVVLSWEGKEDTERADEMTHEFLQENFKESRAIVAIHQDTAHTHAHIWIDARNTNDRKLHSPKNHINELSRSWQKQYDREYKTNYEKEYAAKREKTRQYKEAMHKGKSIEKPNRAEMNSEKWRAKDERDAGIKTNGINKEGVGRNQRFIAERERISKESERGLTKATGQINRTESEARGLHQDAEKLAGKSKIISNREGLER